MKKKIWIICGCIIVAACAAYSALAYCMSYRFVIEANWDYELPGGYTEEYSYSKSGFHGDGIRYHVFKYYNKRSIQKIEALFAEGFTLEAEDERVNGWLEEIAVPLEAYPAYTECICREAAQKDGSEIVLFWNEENKTLYIAEWFQ